jgi:2-oxoacid:acceptor oxidoreductase gamma subunit (pyruvate/2-ketoisovalerate family)/2-oxoacid:acceptor oxidoreductase delta subunit (pyruvate/2-ketoisovalerate family)
MLIVGRGGEGVVLASQLLAETFGRAGLWVHSVPEFKPERRGAPISASVRWDAEAPIHRRYKVQECDVLVVVSPSPPSPEALRAVRPGGLVVLNRERRLPQSGRFAVARVPGSRIAKEHGVLSPEGRPLANAAVLGACVRLLLPDGLAFLEQAIAARLGAAAAANVAAAREGYRRCTRQHALAADTPFESVPAPPAPAPTPAFPVSTADSRGNHTGGWSLDRPVLTSRCTACALCALFCPEGAISRTDGSIEIDYLYCKGCGICERVCPVRDAIAMTPVAA